MKDTMRKLSEDLSRTLIAGAHLASADPELAAARDALERLGAKAPVLGQIAKMLGSAIGGKGADAVKELLSATTAVAQVRAAQVALADCPPGQPLAPVPLVETPCEARDLYDLYDALTKSGAGREEKVKAAVERRDVADLRLVDAVLQALGDPYMGEYVASHAAPLLGQAIVEPVRARLDVKGSGAHGRRLRALVAVEKEGALDLLDRALQGGSAHVREAALDAIADHVPGKPQFERMVLEQIAKDKVHGVKRAAVRALKGYGSDASLDALIAALGVAATRREAAEALQGSTHPRVVDKLVAALEEALGPEEDESPRKGKKKTSAKAVRSDDNRIESLLVALAPRSDPRIALLATRCINRHGAIAIEALIGSADREQLENLAGMLHEKDDTVFHVAVQAIAKLGPKRAFELGSPAFRAKDWTSEVGQKRAAAAAQLVTAGADPRWLDVLVEAAGHPKCPVLVFHALGAVRHPRVVAALCKVLASGSGAAQEAAILALGEQRDPAAIGPILDCVAASKHYMAQWFAREALKKIGDPSAVAACRDRAIAMKDSKTQAKAVMDSLLEMLEKRFPGY